MPREEFQTTFDLASAPLANVPVVQHNGDLMGTSIKLSRVDSGDNDASLLDTHVVNACKNRLSNRYPADVDGRVCHLKVYLNLVHFHNSR